MKTYKVVYNTCYGGFGLSDKAMELYLTKKGLSWSKKRDCGMSVYTVPDIPDFYDKDIPRHDPDLIDVVEELGELANGDCARLEVYELHSSVYKIKQYDGNESIEELYIDDGWCVIE